MKLIEKNIHIAVVNISGLLILIFLQFLVFGFLPSVNPNIQKSEQKSEAIKRIISKSSVLGLETLLGISVLFILNTKLFADLKKVWIIISIDLVVLMITFYYFSNGYLNKFLYT